MKTKLLFLAVLFTASFLSINAQCTDSVLNFGNNTIIPAYNVNGNVNITLNTNNTITLDLASNFSTAEGPDIRAFLVNSNGMTDAQLRNALISNLENVQFGLVGASGSVNQNGAKSFTIPVPTSSSIQNFDTVFFYCLQFDQFWDFGKFTPFTESNCGLLSVEENSLLNTVNFYPNPTNENLTISNDKQLDLNINISNVLGDIVLQTKNNRIRKQIINLSSLKSGVYLMQLKADGQTYTKRLIKQ